MRVVDFIFQYLNETLQVDTVFMVPGGGAMYLNDAVGQNKNIKLICCHHEQAAAMAASGYSRYTGKLGTCVVTTGCGGTNTLTAVLGAYQDRIRMLIISGQVKTQECSCFKEPHLRQFGVQEFDITKLVEPITVASFTLNKGYLLKNLKETLDSIKDCKEQGPIWLDIPIDIQSDEI